MKFSYVIGSCFIVAFFSACQQAEIESKKSDDLRMSIVASINNQKDAPDSRYAGTDPCEVAFGGTDRIGVFIDGGSPLRWTYSSSGWQSDGIVYWPDKTDVHTFYAFYPYVESAGMETVPMPDLTGQTGTFESVSQRDFLIASVSQAYGTNGTVSFQGDHSFKHVSTLVKLTIKGDGDLQSSVLEKIAIQGTSIVAPATYSFTDDVVTLTPDGDSDCMESALDHTMGGKDAVFYYILNAKQTSDETVTLSVEYSTDGTTYVAQLDNFAGNVFQGGMMQSYTLTIKDSSLLISGSSISSWGEGEVMDNIIINGEEQSDETE